MSHEEDERLLRILRATLIESVCATGLDRRVDDDEAALRGLRMPPLVGSMACPSQHALALNGPAAPPVRLAYGAHYSCSNINVRVRDRRRRHSRELHCRKAHDAG